MKNLELQFMEWAKNSGWTCETAREEPKIPQEIKLK